MADSFLELYQNIIKFRNLHGEYPNLIKIPLKSYEKLKTSPSIKMFDSFEQACKVYDIPRIEVI